MSSLALTHTPLFESLTELDFGTGTPEDLTTGYTCRAFVDDGTGIAFIFRRGANGAEISLIFQDAVLLESAGRFAAGTTLDSFQRGRYFLDDALLEEHGGRYFYLLDFVEEDFSLTLAASGVSAQFEEAPI
jgi:hypothetical protein